MGRIQAANERHASS